PGGAASAPGQPPPPNNVRTITATFVDTQDPTATLTEPANNAVVRGTIPIKATAADNDGTPGVTLTAAGRVLAQFTAGPFETTFNTTTVPDGQIQAAATARPAANRRANPTATLTVDDPTPTLPVTAPYTTPTGPGAAPASTPNAVNPTTAVNVRCSVVPAGQAANFGACTSNTQER